MSENKKIGGAFRVDGGIVNLTDYRGATECKHATSTLREVSKKPYAWKLACKDCGVDLTFMPREIASQAALAQQPQGEAVAWVAEHDNDELDFVNFYEDKAREQAATSGGRVRPLVYGDAALPQAAPVYDKSVVKRLATQMGLIPGQDAPVAQGLTREALYEAIHGALMEHGLNYTEDTGSGEKFPLVDKLCAPGDETIETGKQEVALLAESILDVIPAVLAQSAPRAYHSEDARQMVALSDPADQDRSAAEQDAAPSASAQQAEPVAWRHSHTLCLYETREDVPLADGDEWAVPLYLAAPAPSACKTCNDHGMIGGPSYYAPDEGGEPCPDCEPSASPAALTDEREAFEGYASDRKIPLNTITVEGVTAYEWDAVEKLWQGWQARALLAASPATSAPAALTDEGGWLLDGSLLYRLTDERHPQNRDEINVTMADGSRNPEVRAARAGEILALLAASPAALKDTDIERQYKDGIHIGSGLPRATCPCGFCQKYREARTAAQIREEVQLVLTDPDSSLSRGARRALKFIDAAMSASKEGASNG